MLGGMAYLREKRSKKRRAVVRMRQTVVAENSQLPDFAGRLKQIYGNKVMSLSGTDLLAKERSRY